MRVHCQNIKDQHPASLIPLKLFQNIQAGRPLEPAELKSHGLKENNYLGIERQLVREQNSAFSK